MQISCDFMCRVLCLWVEILIQMWGGGQSHVNVCNLHVKMQLSHVEISFLSEKIPIPCENIHFTCNIIFLFACKTFSSQVKILNSCVKLRFSNVKRQISHVTCSQRTLNGVKAHVEESLMTRLRHIMTIHFCYWLVN